MCVRVYAVTWLQVPAVSPSPAACSRMPRLQHAVPAQVHRLDCVSKATAVYHSCLVLIFSCLYHACVRCINHGALFCALYLAASRRC